MKTKREIKQLKKELKETRQAVAYALILAQEIEMQVFRPDLYPERYADRPLEVLDGE